MKYIYFINMIYTSELIDLSLSLIGKTILQKTGGDSDRETAL